jgi:uncharacterized membrane protein YkvA (DUF1232 family)
MLKRVRLNKVFRIVPLLAALFGDFPVLLRMVKSYFTGSYRSISRGAIFKILFAFCYLVFFVDLIPDFIPLVGWVDDIAVFAWVASSLKEEIESFRQWEAGK